MRGWCSCCRFVIQISYITDRHRPRRSQDVIELRERRWVPRDAFGVPTTIAQVHKTVGASRRPQARDRCTLADWHLV
jgi:hypothetical protein